MASGDEHRWAIETFGDAALGDARRRSRLIRLAAGVACRPGGTVTGVFETSAAREAAFRFLENEDIRRESVAQAAFAATARNCRAELVYVAVDQSSLTLGDRAGKRQLGRVGNTLVTSRGLQVMTALAVDPAGAPVGLVAQT